MNGCRPLKPRIEDSRKPNLRKLRPRSQNEGQRKLTDFPCFDLYFDFQVSHSQFLDQVEMLIES